MEVDFTDLLTHYQIYGDWERVADKLGDREGIAYLKKYVENWVNDEYLPEEYAFKFKPTKAESKSKEILAFTEKLKSSMSGEDVHNLVYSIAKECDIGTSALFKALYWS